MKRVLTACLTGVLLCSCTSGDRKESERYIIDSERQWAESVATGDTIAIERILAGDFIGTDLQGRSYDKAKMISDHRGAPKHFVSNRFNQVKIRFFGETAVVWEPRAGEHGRFAWRDTWMRRNGKWQIVGAEGLIAPGELEKP